MASTMFRARLALARLKHRQLCTGTAKPNNKKKGIGGDNGGDGNKQPSSVTRYNETYSQLGKLDFMTAAKILFTEPPKKKFGLDFHLDFQHKKKKEEEMKAKEDEQKANELEERSNSALSEMKTRLEQLEVAVKEIVVDKKKGSTNEDQHVSKTQSGTPSK